MLRNEGGMLCRPVQPPGSIARYPRYCRETQKFSGKRPYGTALTGDLADITQLETYRKLRAVAGAACARRMSNG